MSGALYLGGVMTVNPLNSLPIDELGEGALV